MTAQPRPPDHPQGLEAEQYAVLERVVPEPLARCSDCDDVIFAGDWQDPRTGRCVHCVGRAWSPMNWISFAALILLAAAAIAFLGYVTAPRSAPDPTGEMSSYSERPTDGAVDPSLGDLAASGPGPSGAPSAGTSGAPAPTAETIEPIQETAPRYRGTATWYCLSDSSTCTVGYGQDDLVAAIDSDLGFAKGDVVVVRYRDRAVAVQIVDVCACPGERLIDLTSGAFQQLAPLGLGVIPVTIERAVNQTLPPTDVEP